MGRWIAISTLLLTAGLSGCPGVGGVDCTAIAAVSVTATVVDADGDDVAEAEVTYQGPDDAEPRPCEAHAGVYLCGYEVAGAITVRADAWGHGTAEQTVVVEEDECHVIGQAITVELPPLDCTDEAIPSVIVAVEDTGGAAVADAAVAYLPVGAGWSDPEPCERMADDHFVCGEEIAGAIELSASAPDHYAASAEVDVAQGECHVITEEYTFVLDAV